MSKNKELVIKYAPRVALGLGVAVVSYGVARKLGLFGKKDKKKDILEKASNAIKKYPNATLKLDDFYSMADAINEAFKSVDFTGTDEQAVYDELRKLNTQDDWQVLQITYGERKKGFPPVLFDPKGLKASIIDESDDYYVFSKGKKFLSVCKEILEEKGIQF